MTREHPEWIAAFKALPGNVSKSDLTRIDMDGNAESRPGAVLILLSDGEIAEGSNWEAILFAAHHKLENLVAIVDYNNLQSLTSVEETLNIDPLEAKFIAFGWDVFQLDGHNLDALVSTLKVAKAEKNGKPKVIIAKTTKGKGVSFMENKVLWHYKTPDENQFIKYILYCII